MTQITLNIPDGAIDFILYASVVALPMVAIAYLFEYLESQNEI